MFAICREYGQPPAWYLQLPHEERVMLLADWRIRHQPTKPKSTQSGRAFWMTSDA